MQIAIRYFSGTGNTAHACAIAADVFKNAGWSVDVAEFGRTTAKNGEAEERADLLLVAFPVLGFAPPQPVAGWLSRLKKRAGQQAAVLAIGGATFVKGRYIPGWGADAPFSAARVLKRKGRKIAGIGEASLPENFTQASNPPTEADCREIRKRNDPVIRAYAEALVASIEKGERGPIMARNLAVRALFMPIAGLFRLFGRKILSRTFISTGECNGCGLCARHCPVEAIRLETGRPSWGVRCVECNRCINICPKGAIRTSSLSLLLHLFFFGCSLAAALSVPLPYAQSQILSAGSRLLLMLALFCVQLWPFALILKKLSRTSVLSKKFETSFTRTFRRYTAEGFRPE